MLKKSAVTLVLLYLFAGQTAFANTISTKIIAGNTVSVEYDNGVGALVLNGQKLFTNDNGAVGIRGSYPASGKTFILAEVDQGASCAHFRIVALSGRQAAISPEFGNCEDNAKVSVVGGVLHVRIPVWRSVGIPPASDPAQTHSFDGTRFR